MKYLFILLVSFIVPTLAGAQLSFLDNQLVNPRVAEAFKSKQDTLEKQFLEEHLQWPPKQLYIRSFKYDSKMEVWVRNDSNDPFKLFKVYKICALSGALGPKRVEGDYQVPEGCYYINLFNPKSDYHLSLGLNYPNASDAILSDSIKPGGDIYIHGNCITVGCIPIQDKQVEELYILASEARSAGEDFIPVHIFPVQYNNPRSVDILEKATKDDQQYQRFSVKLKEVYDYFDQHKKLPVISVNKKGEYIFM